LISVLQLGTLDYASGLQLQQRLVDLRKEGHIGDVLLLLEHTPVITLGRNAKEKNILASPELLAQRGVEVFECNRGGDVTFHGPGQLVGYPIFDLRSLPSSDGTRKTLGAIEYVRRLEEVLMRTCADFSIPTKRICGLTGVWTTAAPEGTDAAADMCVGTGAIARPAERRSAEASPDSRNSGVLDANAPDKAKIAAIGVHISRAVTSHGFALNVNTDLNYFNLIIPCGITAKPVTSMAKELGRELSLPKVANSISRNFGVVFEAQLQWLDSLKALISEPDDMPLEIPENLRKLHGEEETFRA
jgi:lipoyl(octanoyl) transferase